MKTLRSILSSSVLLSLGVVALGSAGCAEHERVVVHDRPVEVVRPAAEVRVVAPPPPVVQERVIVRP